MASRSDTILSPLSSGRTWRLFMFLLRLARGCRVFLLTLAALLLLDPQGSAQSFPGPLSTANNTGTNPFQTYAGVRENIDLATGGLNVTIPLLTLPGRDGFDLVLAAAYDSKNWQLEGLQDSNLNWNYWWDWDTRGSFGWSGLVSTLGNFSVSGPVANSTCTSYILLMPDGTKHSYSHVKVNCFNNHGPLQPPSYPTASADDNSYSFLDATNVNAPVITLKNGTKLYFTGSGGITKMEDTNGNSITYTGSTITDTLNRVITFSSSGSATTITYKDS